MTPDLLAVARRAVACPKWRWMPGMRTTDGFRVVIDLRWEPDRPVAIAEKGWIDTNPARPLKDHLPDLTDPATCGCLLALVREAWGNSTVCIVFDGKAYREWCVGNFDYDRIFRGSYGFSEAEALVTALEREIRA